MEGLELSSFKPHTDDSFDPSLPRIPAKIPRSSLLVAMVELCERFAFYGLSGPFQNYVQHSPTDKIPGKLGLGSRGANILSYFFQFWCYATPLLGAYIADSYWGKYKTIVVFSAVYMAGIAILFLSSLPAFSADASTSLAWFVLSIVVIGLGTGGVKANVSPLVADQVPQRSAYATVVNGARRIVDPALTMQQVFMIFYFCINVGSLSAIFTTLLEMKVGFWAAFLLPLVFFLFALIALFAGSNSYVKKPPSRSVISHSFHIVWILLRTGGDVSRVVPSSNPHAHLPWTDAFVGEVTQALSTCKVFLFFPVYWLVYGQMLNNFVAQAATMNTHGIPNDIMQNIDPITLLIAIPLVERLLSYVRIHHGVVLSDLSRIRIGFFLAALAMFYASLLQHFIYGSKEEIHIAWQAPSYVFIALSEIFASITGLEYAYKNAPELMKSFIMSLYLVTTAGGSMMGVVLGLSGLVRDPWMVWNYAGLGLMAAGAGWWFGRCFIHKGYARI
ncbi:hypothetical protein BABINDRAFT_179772 [Babjeviella inositovora NRRL Y-12698]|uniref:Major facilitator superfamily (MFS) profile domain-containing protein n=1 Tax=Babjeviella inositovora NRRL Y-12698 TaxID=984486 RepID=A0A1E3QUA3_9ASCO|nr:uncharacterized protein BABINDRAFT_179772 [Babjeviella inositovora NRRL Y-12698]ODQ81261.1 hypothetical protein BABINDRAFT_179772 [Babjeviella inositovora NRRL Y-12698]